MFLPPLSATSSGGLSNLIPPGSAAARAEADVAHLFGFPIDAAVAIVQRDPHGMPAVVRDRALRQAIAVDRRLSGQSDGQLATAAAALARAGHPDAARILSGPVSPGPPGGIPGLAGDGPRRQSGRGYTPRDVPPGEFHDRDRRFRRHGGGDDRRHAPRQARRAGPGRRQPSAARATRAPGPRVRHPHGRLQHRGRRGRRRHPVRDQAPDARPGRPRDRSAPPSRPARPERAGRRHHRRSDRQSSATTRSSGACPTRRPASARG